jgi:LPS export ABC transporter protein LptC
MNCFKTLGIIIVAVNLLIACNNVADNPVPKVKYNGPIMQTGNVTTLYSDSAMLKIKLQAKVESRFENGNAEYPQGINLTFYDQDQKVSSTLRANYAKYDKQRDSYFARGNVIVNNIKKNETMKTEELHWDKLKRQIYTDKFVSIQTNTDVVQGNGLVSDDGFVRWKILNPTGSFTVEKPQ